MSKKLTTYFKDYAAFHETPGNKVTHYFGIPFIVISLLGLLSTLIVPVEGLVGSPSSHLDGGTILLVLGHLVLLSIGS